MISLIIPVRRIHAMKALSTLIAIAVIVAAGFFVKDHMQKSRLIQEENAATDAWNAKDYENAAGIYKALIPKFDPAKDATKIKSLKQNLANCFRQLASPSLSIKEQARHIQRIADLDETLLTDEDRRLLKAAKGTSSKAETGEPKATEEQKN